MEPILTNSTPVVRTSRPWLGLLLGVWALFLFVALTDFKPEQSWWHTTMTLQASADDTQIPERPENLMGGLGVILAFWSLWFFGMAAYLGPMYMGWVSYLMFAGQALRVNKARLWAIAACLVSAAAWLSLFQQHFVSAKAVNYDFFPGGLGGQIGVFFYHVFLLQFLGTFGSTVVMLLLFGGGTAMIFTDEIQKLWAMTRTHFTNLMAPPVGEVPVIYDSDSADAQNSDGAAKAKKPRKKIVDSVKELLSRKGKKTAEPSQADILSSVGKKGKKEAAPKATPSEADLKITALKLVTGAPVAKAPKTAFPKRKNGFHMPTLEILTQAVHTDKAILDEGHQETAAALVRILSEFGVKVAPGEIHMGPVVTRYDVTPAQGVRVEKILNLEKNLQLGLRSQSVRILAPVPGKNCVGVELPNKNPEQVLLRDILESSDWSRSTAEIPVAIGKETSGKPLIADLARMPHLLIAGATGSGKTVCLNSIIASLLYRFTPEDLRFVMVDPKIIELQVYNDLPHMLIPVVTSPKRVPAALKYLINEMEMRYKIFAKTGVKNLAGFNAKRARDIEAMEAAQHAETSPEERAAIAEVADAAKETIEIPDHLPYIVAVIDELADLMMVAPADIENSVVRLAQLARAAGIHLIIATQRPSVNVITGLIKANLPSRIAFKVASQVDSRTILDCKGADMLIGRGDMLFTPPGAFSMLRAQGAYVTEEEIARIMEALKVNGAPKFDEDFVYRLEKAEEEANAEEGGSGSSSGGADVSTADLESALDVLTSTQRASTSMLQRKLGWGYNRAARVMEELESRGVVGAGEGAKPREILRSTLD